MKTRAFLAAGLAAATTTLSASAQQPWLKDRATGEGIGIRTGNLELHPGIAGEFGYDSNYFQRADDEDPIIDVFKLRVTPHLTLKTLGPERRGPAPGAPPTINFMAGVYATYTYLLAEDSDNQDAVDEHNNNVDVGLNFALDILPQRPVGFDIYGDYRRSVEPSNVAVEESAFDRDSVRLGAGISWRPGGGLFESRLGYELNYHYFERTLFQLYNNSQHSLMLRNRWRFLPRTALLSDSRVTWIRYSEDTDQHDGTTFRSLIGVNGLITNRFSLLAMAGWGASFYETHNAAQTRNYEGPLAHAEIKWFLLPQPQLQPGDATVGLSTVAAGYTRDYANSYLGDYYRRDRVYGNFSYFIGGVAVISLEGGFSWNSHPETFFETGAPRTGEFTEKRADATLFGEYRPTDTIGINTTLRYTSQLDDIRVPVSATTSDNLQFSRYEAYIGVRWFM